MSYETIKNNIDSLEHDKIKDSCQNFIKQMYKILIDKIQLGNILKKTTTVKLNNFLNSCKKEIDENPKI